MCCFALPFLESVFLRQGAELELKIRMAEASFVCAVDPAATDLSLVIKATHFAAIKHKAQRRKDKEETPYINHPVGVAHILMFEGRKRKEVTCSLDRLKKKLLFHSFRSHRRPRRNPGCLAPRHSGGHGHILRRNRGQLWTQNQRVRVEK